VWGHHATAAHVTDSAGNRYTQVLRRVARDGTEMSVWTAPITAGGGTVPTITVTPSATADVGAVAVEYSGLSRAPGLAAIDKAVSAHGVTRNGGVVGSPAAHSARGRSELAVGLYADSGFGAKLLAGRGFRARVNISATTTSMEQFVEDRVVAGGTRVGATVRTGSKTPWLMGLVLFKGASAPAVAARTAQADSGSTNTGPAATAVNTALELNPPPPLSRRARPHPAAGAITGATGRNANGKVVRYYCLVDPTGKKDTTKRTAADNPFAWMPAVRPLA
jgi:hypothetical protein